MNISKANLGNYRNEEHFQFQTEFKGLVERYTPGALDIEESWAVYAPLFNNEEMVVNLIRKSARTSDIARADQRRDSAVRGIEYAVKAATFHFNPEKKEAAQKLEVLLDRFGAINRKSYEAQTAATMSILDDLNKSYLSEVGALGLSEWLTELQASNEAFVVLMNERYTEIAGKPQFNMRTARKELDAAYRTITQRLEALMIVNGDEAYKAFANQLNQRVQHYNTIIARRRGRNATKP